MAHGLSLAVRTFRAMVFPVGVPVVLLLAAPCINRGQQRPSLADLLHRFESTTVFWQQIEVAKEIVAAHDISVLPKLQGWLTNEDRHLRGNAAFIYAGLGNPRGFDVIVAILGDRSERRRVDKISSVGLPSVEGQIREDRYYAAHLLGNLKDVRAIPILVPLLNDTEVNYIVPWSLGQIGDGSAIQPLIRTLSISHPSMRVLAIYALVELNATEALPRLRQLLGDNERSHFDKLESVAEAARDAIAKLQAEPPR